MKMKKKIVNFNQYFDRWVNRDLMCTPTPLPHHFQVEGSTDLGALSNEFQNNSKDVYT